MKHLTIIPIYAFTYFFIKATNHYVTLQQYPAVVPNLSVLIIGSRKTCTVPNKLMVAVNVSQTSWA